MTKFTLPIQYEDQFIIVLCYKLTICIHICALRNVVKLVLSCFQPIYYYYNNSQPSRPPPPLIRKFKKKCL